MIPAKNRIHSLMDSLTITQDGANWLALYSSIVVNDKGIPVDDTQIYSRHAFSDLPTLLDNVPAIFNSHDRPISFKDHINYLN